MTYIPTARIRMAVIATLLAILILPLSTQPAVQADSSESSAGRWIIQLNSGWAERNGWSDVLSILGDSDVDALPSVPWTYVAQFAGETRASDAIARLSDHPAIAYVEPDIAYERQTDFTPNDQFFVYQQWANTVNLPGAWAISAGRSDVVVAVVDTGIRADHPDLAGKVITGYNVVEETTDTTDIHGHGTLVAGVVAATGNNGIGIAGAAMNVRLMPVKVTSTDTAIRSAIANGIRYAVDNGADVINVSWGSTSDSALIRQQLQYAHSHNVVVVAAAGNERDKVSFPATEREVISVGATSLDGTRLRNSSSRLSRVDLVAPGEKIVSTHWSPQTGSAYAEVDGTSVAAPIVAGTAALMKSVNPELTVEDIRLILTGTAIPQFQDDPIGTGAGLLDARAALRQVVLPSYGSTWLPADEPVSSFLVQRTWLWGPYSFDVRAEQYQEAELGLRLVAYYDKSRMEITDVYGDRSSEWYVTNGLLVNELITGQLQIGDHQFEQRAPADVPVAGDPNDPDSPTYASFTGLLNEPSMGQGAVVTQTLSRDGSVGNNNSLASHGVTVQEFIPETGKRVADVFWDYLTSTGTLREQHQYIDGPIFSPTFFATGFPVTNPYWAKVRVGGVQQDVLIQCFERRCLTFTPANEPAWQTEMGNVGQHYYRWRYGAEPGGAFSHDPTAFAMQYLR